MELPEDYRELQQLAVERGVPANGTAEEIKARLIASNNPATEHLVDEIKSREYEVTGTHTVLGHEPGSTFVAVIPPEQEERLIRRSQIKPVEGDTPSQED